jgi:Protein of unknown function (DUF3592)
MTSTSRPPLYLFTLFWSLFSCAFLAFVIYGTYNQFRTLSFASVNGIMDRITETTSHSSGDNSSTTHGIDAAYEYVVHGQRYHAIRVRFAAGSSSDNWASAFVRNHPRGTILPVFYNPANPAESVLIRGIEGSDLFLFIFLTPFLMAMIGLWMLTLRTLFPNPARSFGITDHGPITRIRPPLINALGAGAASLGLTSFFAIFIIAFLAGGFHPSLRVTSLTLQFLPLFALLVTLISFFRIALGKCDITLDDVQQLLRAPRNKTIPYAAITGIHVRASAAQSSSKKASIQYGAFRVLLKYTLHQTAKDFVIKQNLQDLATATRLASYLALRLNTSAYAPDNTPLLPAPLIQPSSATTA